MVRIGLVADEGMKAALGHCGAVAGMPKAFKQHVAPRYPDIHSSALDSGRAPSHSDRLEQHRGGESLAKTSKNVHASFRFQAMRFLHDGN
jgi:hypothetical protein